MIKKACLVAAAMLPAVGFGQNEYPSRPVHIYVASTAGGPLDTTARFAANWWQRRLGQPFIVEARPGANQLLAIDALMRERPDGYTLLSVTSGLGSSLASMKAAPYSLTKDFAPIAMICAGGLILTTSTSVPVKTMEEFVRYLKSNPGKVNYGEPGVPVIELDEILNLLGVGASVTRVRYKGGDPVQQALLSGEIHFGASRESLVKNNPGKLRALAYTGASRFPWLPDVPTLSETVLPGYQTQSWLGMMGRAGLPTAVSNLLNRELQDALKTPEAETMARTVGMVPTPGTVDAMRQEIESASKRIENLVQKGILVPQ
ncbi:MAG TPA: tripartite tricarboxylate transporter substrate binding protein [Methylomirabilota bacterium]|nr:tripartite tricarboxylate transporter substrate binding protein [Methylomirabilota bacterium]